MDTIDDLIQAHSFSEAEFWVYTRLHGSVDTYIICLWDEKRMPSVMGTLDLHNLLLNDGVLYHCLDTSTARSIVSLSSNLTMTDSQRVKKQKH